MEGGVFCTLFNTSSSATPQIPLCRRMLGSNRLLRLWYWQSDALTTRLDLIYIWRHLVQFAAVHLWLHNITFTTILLVHQSLIRLLILCPFAVYCLRYAVKSFFTMSRISLADGKRAGQKVYRKIAVAVQNVKPLYFLSRSYEIREKYCQQSFFLY